MKKRSLEKTREYNQRWRLNNPEAKLYSVAKSRAKKQGVAFTLNKSDVVIPECCPVFGFPLTVAQGGRGFNDTSPTLDRFNNTKGYVPGNVRVISWRANRLKCDATLEELKALVAYMEI